MLDRVSCLPGAPCLLDLLVNVNITHFKNFLLRAIVTQGASGIISQSRELSSSVQIKLCNFVIYENLMRDFMN